VVNADFAEAMRSLIPNKHRLKWSDMKIARKKYSRSTFMMYLGIEGRYEDVALAENYRQNLHDMEELHELWENPSGWRDEFGLWKGATFSMKHSLDPMLHLRPHNRFEEVDGIYLMGGGTHPGSGLPVIFQSARISSKLLLEGLDIEPRWPTSSELAMRNDMMQVAL
jgi:phytoene dehydrogenase-like protein